MPFPRRFLSLLAIPFALAACDLSSSLAGNDTLVGLAVVPVTPGTNNNFLANPVVQFARNAALTLPNTTLSGDQCAGPSPIGGGGGGGTANNIDAGASIAWTQGQTQATLVPLVSGTSRQYVPTSASGIPVQPGGLVTLDIPGADNGFPAMTITARLADALTGIGPINPQPPGGQGLLLQWNAPAAAADSAKLEVLLQYNIAGGTPDQQIVCRLDDDGTHTVDDGLLVGWRSAPDNSKRVVITRFRSYLRAVGDAQFGFLSTFVVNKNTLP